jgi:hypothetical protein
MPKTSTLIDLTIGMTDADKLAAGSDGQILLTKHETEESDILEYYDTVVLANAAKTDWDT